MGGQPPSGPASGAIITVPSPAPGGQFVYTVPANRTFHLVSIRIAFTTDGTAADRYMFIYIDDGVAVPYYHALSNVKISATSAIGFCFATGVDTQGSTAITYGNTPLSPHLFLGPGYRINSGIVSIQAGDQLTDIRLGVERYV